LEQPIPWTRNDYSRVPNLVYHDPELYRLEMQRIFQGEAWLFMGFEAEVPRPDDFRTTFLGEVPVLFNRAQDGTVHAFVNRCAHRGAVIRRELSGNARSHVCVYHQWCYNQQGDLVGVPFQRGIAGEGGASKAFRREDHPLQKLRVASHEGLLFATFSHKAPPLLEYLGETIAAHIARVVNGRRMRIIGYQRQTVRGNWKLYAENSRDQYHGSLLHKFLGTFLTKTTTAGGLTLDPRHRHSLIYSTPTRTFTGPLSDSADLVHDVEQFNDPRVVAYLPEFGDDYPYGNAICSLFPNAVFQQIRNSLATRQLRPRGPEQFELFWTLFGFEEDDAALREHRLLQVNMGGPAGFVSSEDGEAIELAHRATKAQPESVSLLEMGGTGPIPDRVTTRMNELALRGFWSYYSELMGTEPEAAIR
jgi:anthranilate 1,2-dioxygenase large subunit